jgi:hypothetical protein
MHSDHRNTPAGRVLQFIPILQKGDLRNRRKIMLKVEIIWTALREPGQTTIIGYLMSAALCAG